MEGGECVCGRRGVYVSDASISGRWEVAVRSMGLAKRGKAWNRFSVNVVKRGLEMITDCWVERQISQP